MQGDIDHVTPLTIENVSRIHFRGGSHLGIARANPTKDPKLLENTLTSLLRLNVSQLITIGGDDTAYSAMMLERHAAGAIRVVHVPKTIDNDLYLPDHVDTFGFQSARHYGAEIVKNLMVDAKTTSRWYFVIAMGRKAGHLALGIGKAAGTTLTLISEEFPAPIRLKTIVDTLAGAIIKRLSEGRRDGVAVIAEGVVLDIARRGSRRHCRTSSATATATCGSPKSISARFSRRRCRRGCATSRSRRPSPRRTSATSSAARIRFRSTWNTPATSATARRST